MQVLKDDIRDKILKTAENIFYEKGFKDTTTRSIAEEVGISVSNLYLYYQNKEAIFIGVVDEFYKYLINNIETFFSHQDESSEVSISISSLIEKIIIADGKKFVIISDKSQGTKYEGFKQHMIITLNNHMNTQVNKSLVKDELILYILSKNFIEGIIEIAKHYKDKDWLESCINTLVTYHMNGIAHLM